MIATDSEKYVLGCVIGWPDRFPEIMPHVAAAQFSDPLHQRIYRKFVDQHLMGGVDPMLAATELGQAGYFLELKDLATTTAHVPTEAAKIVEASNKRRLSEATDHALKACANGRPFDSILYELKNSIQDFERDTSMPQEQFTLRELRRQYPKLNEPVVDGLFRAGETVNIISHSKAGKSWFAYLLALSIIDGRKFLDQFNTTPGKVLLIDNELHRSTLAYRIPAVADALAIPAADYENDLVVWPLRGKLRSLHDVCADLEAIEPGEYQAIIFDSKYRFATTGVSENDNGPEAQIYNLLDQCGDRTGAANVLIHHASKGNQSDKRVTDVGAGAGAQSRAADTHLVIREHDEPDVAVLEAALRSFAPVQPLAIKWVFPLWLPTDSVDPGKLKGRLTRSEQRQGHRDREGINKIVDALRGNPATARKLRAKTGLSRDRQERLLNQLSAKGHVKAEEITVRGNQCDEFHLVE